MNVKAVIGIGFGDEGKGLVTNYLSLQNPKAAIIRYSGGQQAGHTVVKDELRHIFSNFGSGSLNGAPTYWSQYCTVDPVGIYNELKVLEQKGIRPILHIHAKCPVTTPLDKQYNQSMDAKNGTCGTGVGSTKRREEAYHSLLFEDLFNKTVFDIKYGLMEEFYLCTANNAKFREAIDFITTHAQIKMYTVLPSVPSHIFEGSQGLLLDQHYGFFPHVTRSNVGTTNILEMGYTPKCYAVTRAYQTRHGNGPMTNEHFDHNIQPNPLETNVYNKWQGEFRISILDLDLLQYAVSKDEYLNKHRDVLVITCLDHVEHDWQLTINGQLIQALSEYDFIDMINTTLGFSEVLLSHSDKSENLKSF